MTLAELAKIAAAIGGGVVLIAFIFLIAVPAWTAYGRSWEKASALFLSFYVLVAMLAIGATLGLVAFKVLGEQF